MRAPLFRMSALAPRSLFFAAVLSAVLVPLSLGNQPDSAAVERYMGDVRALAAPEMRGRGAGTPELDRAAEYIANQLRDAGLVPAGTTARSCKPSK